MSKLEEKVWIPLGFAISFIGGGGYWLASLDLRQQAQAATAIDHQARLEKVIDYMQSIDRRLSTIEGSLQELAETKRHEHRRK